MGTALVICAIMLLFMTMPKAAFLPVRMTWQQRLRHAGDGLASGLWLAFIVVAVAGLLLVA